MKVFDRGAEKESFLKRRLVSEEGIEPTSESPQTGFEDSAPTVTQGRTPNDQVGREIIKMSHKGRIWVAPPVARPFLATKISFRVGRYGAKYTPGEKNCSLDLLERNRGISQGKPHCL